MLMSIIITAGRFLRSLRAGFREPEFRALFLFVILLLVTGSVFYWQVEKWSFLDALYFCVTTLTTVSTHLEPSTAAGKIFTIVYIFLGLGTVAAFVAAIAQHTKEQQLLVEHVGKSKKK